MFGPDRQARVWKAPTPYIAMGITLALWFLGASCHWQEVQVKDFAPNLLSYNTLVLSFSVAAVALVIALPNEGFIKFIAAADSSGKSPFRDLVFVFSWTAFIHWLALCTILLLLLFARDFVIFPLPTTLSGGLMVNSAFMVIQIYSVAQFLSTIITVWQVGDLYGAYLARR